MRPDASELLAFPVDRIPNRAIADILDALANIIMSTNDPDTLRALGQTMKMMGAYCRSAAFDQTGNHW